MSHKQNIVMQYTKQRMKKQNIEMQYANIVMS